MKMMAKKKKTPAQKILYQGKYLRLLDRNGWECVERTHCSGIVIVLAMTAEGKVVFAEQYRAPVQANVIEFPAGLVDDGKSGRGEKHEESALRELEEETGYRAKRIVRLIDGPVNTGLSADKVAIFRAYGLKKVSAGGGDPLEDITVHEIPLPKVPSWIKSMERKGRLVDPKIYAGLYFLTQGS